MHSSFLTFVNAHTYSIYSDNGTLVIDDVRINDVGIYICNVSNEYGADMRRFNLTVFGAFHFVLSMSQYLMLNISPFFILPPSLLSSLAIFLLLEQPLAPELLGVIPEQKGSRFVSLRWTQPAAPSANRKVDRFIVEVQKNDETQWTALVCM